MSTSLCNYDSLYLSFTLGNYLTQTFSVFLTTCGVFLLAFSTWQYSITEPQCCYDTGNLSVLASVSGHPAGDARNWSGSCSELHKVVPLGDLSLHMSPNLLLALAVVGLVVRTKIVE